MPPGVFIRYAMDDNFGGHDAYPARGRLFGCCTQSAPIIWFLTIFPGYIEHTCMKQTLSLFCSSLSDAGEYSQISYDINGNANTESHD
jgi:hypothetical protein